MPQYTKGKGTGPFSASLAVVWGPEGLWRCKLEKKDCTSAKCTTRVSTFPVRFVKLFFEKRLTIRMACGIIIKSSGRDPVRHLGVAQLVARYLGVVEAASSSLVTQTSSEVHNEPPNFLYFTGFFGILGACTTSKTSAIFLLKIGSKSGTTTCLTTFVTKKLYSIRVFDTLRF